MNKIDLTSWRMAGSYVEQTLYITFLEDYDLVQEIGRYIYEVVRRKYSNE